MASSTFAMTNVKRGGRKKKFQTSALNAPASNTGPRPTFNASKTTARRKRSEEHTSELQSPCNLVCRLLLEKKKSGCARTDHVELLRRQVNIIRPGLRMDDQPLEAGHALPSVRVSLRMCVTSHGRAKEMCI